MVKNCPTCLFFCNQQSSELAIKHPVPQECCSLNPLAADFFRLYGHYYLLVVDYNFKLFAVENLKNLQSLTVINKYNKIFSQYGISKELTIGNRPEFTSHHFKNFSKSWDFKQQTVSPHYHQSNDLVEWSIQTVKRTLKKNKI